MSMSPLDGGYHGTVVGYDRREKEIQQDARF